MRVPITAEPSLFTQAVDLGRQVLWLHTFGQAFADPSAGRPPGPPRVPDSVRPKIQVPIAPPGGPLPERLDYDADTETLYLGDGEIAPVSEAVYRYTVGRSNVLRSWLDFRWAHRDTRATRQPERSSPLDEITHTQWHSLFDDDLVDILNVLTLLVGLHPQQAEVLDGICNAALLDRDALDADGALPPPGAPERAKPRVTSGSGASQLWDE